jgi:hypothetical protein
MMELLDTYTGVLICGILVFSIAWMIINDIIDKKYQK